VSNCNALAVSPKTFNTYDYVVGNPPYGKLNGSFSIPDHFQDVLAGRPNLYQLFLKLAFLLAKRGGIIHQITPTGFIGGDYSRCLRGWIQREGAPLQFDFLEKRTGVFESVQQELVISLFKRGSRKRVVDCNVIKCNGAEVDEKPLSSSRFLRGQHWVLPRRPADSQVVTVFDGDSPTLESAGFQVKTGYVVPYRHDELLTPRKRKNSYPLIWAEAIRSEGLSPEYAYSHGRTRWMTHVNTCPGLIRQPCVLIKRTSSKEQSQRIQAAVVSADFIDKYGGFYAENHINVLIPEESSASSLEGLTKLLQTDVVNSLFRCINGTVTVSATELIRLPMPPTDALKEFTKRTKRLRCKHPRIEVAAMYAYGLTDGEA
jgi:adenine-specific DNA-methyltransferase